METERMSSNVITTAIECDYCHATYKLTFVKQLAGLNELEAYQCPECDKTYFVRAFSPIMKSNVVLLTTRKDGLEVKFDNSFIQNRRQA